ncbi:hypothetical protein J5U21_01721 [Saccharolobus shibatae]|uniref:Uncharacterized protein n=1 Tax=Saccharolobus shibatae TaxID=2286 RepID=A0A8F5GWI6_9CREN|nr:hypothetical protein J5U21_01721 [Saccharolobus shibatae]
MDVFRVIKRGSKNFFKKPKNLNETNREILLYLEGMNTKKYCKFT